MTDQQVSNHPNITTLPKAFTPYVQPTKAYQTFVPSVIPVISPPTVTRLNDNKNQQTKFSKINSNISNISQVSSNNSNFSQIKAENYAFKPSPTFLDRNHIGMKASMMTSENQHPGKVSKIQTSSQFLGVSQAENNNLNLKKIRATENNDMKVSTLEVGNQGIKIPSFLQNKDKKNQKSQLIKSTNSYKSDGEEGSLSRSIGLKNNKSQKYQQPAENAHAIISQWIKPLEIQKEKLINKNQVTINDFQLIKELGSGKYGKVFLVRQKKTNFICALKILQKSLIKQQQIIGQLTRQLKIQSFLNHKNLIKMYGFFDDDQNIYLIMEAATGGQLFKHLKKHQSMPEAKVASIMRQVCQAVTELHSHRIIHRDIKPQNIVLHDNVVKLCDFGWSVYCDSTLRTTFCGTPLYVGPQILKGKQYDQKIDIWSLGVMMYEMLVGENPFQISKQQDLIKIIKEQIKIPSYIEISNQAKDFLFSCLKKNPQDRTIIRQLMNHEFFKKYPQKSDKKLGV